MGLETAIIGGLAAGGLGAGLASSVGAPSMPSSSKVYYTMALTDIMLSPLRAAALYGAALGQKVQTVDPRTGKIISLDFTGLGDVQRVIESYKQAIESSRELAKRALEVSKEISPQIAQWTKEFTQSLGVEEEEIATAYRQNLLDYLAGKVPRSVSSQLTQTERAAQAARGVMLSPSSAAREALRYGQTALNLQQLGMQLSPVYMQQLSLPARAAMMQQLTQIPFNYAAYVPQMQYFAPQTLYPQAGIAALDYATQMYRLQQQYNPWASFFGQVSGLGLGMAGTALGGYLWRRL